MLTLSVLLWSFITLLTPMISSSVNMLIFSRVLLGVAEGVGKYLFFYFKQIFVSYI